MKINSFLCLLLFPFIGFTMNLYASTCTLQNSSNDDFHEVICKHLTPNPMQTINNFIIESESLVPSYIETDTSYSGYDSNNVKLNYHHDVLAVTNNTPRAFAELAFVSDGQAYYIKHNLKPFTTIRFKITQPALSSGEKTFLDPSPAFRPIISGFIKLDHNDKNKELIYFKQYGLLISWLKLFYDQKSTREEFFHYFLNKRQESFKSTLAKWYTINTYNEPKNYYVLKTKLAGWATIDWLSMNWPMESYEKDKSYVGIHGGYAHEYAHTMGYGHDSGLAYGWDSFIDNKIAKLMASKDFELGQPIQESSLIYWYYDKKNSQIIPYFIHAGIRKPILKQVSLIYPRAPHITFLNEQDSIKIINKRNDRINPILVNAETMYGGKRYSYITPAINMDNIFYALNTETINFSLKTPSGDSSVYFYVPPQDTVVSSESSSPDDRKWNAGDGYTKIVVKAFNKDNKKYYNIVLRGNKKYLGKFDKKLNEGYEKGFGAAKISFLKEDNPNLPTGAYHLYFRVIGQGWHDKDYRVMFFILDELKL